MMSKWPYQSFSSDIQLNREINRFFELTFVTGKWMVPTEQIDEIAHQLIEDGTMDRVSKGLGKEYVHDSSITGERLAVLYAETIGAYKAHFGEDPPSQYWAPPSSVGTRSSPAACAMIMKAACGHIAH